jgi:uncharacterized protein (DUF2062 family)
MVAKGFSIGIAIEMFTFPTAGLAFFLIFPLVILLRGNIAGALIGFVIGKVIYIPFAFLNSKVGSLIVPEGIEGHLGFLPLWMANIILGSLNLIVGGIIVGSILGLVLYFPVKLLLEFYAHRRKEKRKIRKAKLVLQENITK